MPRRSDERPKVYRKVRIYEDLANKVELLLYDPVRQDVRYGDWSKLLNMLIANWLESNPTDEDIQNVKQNQG